MGSYRALISERYSMADDINGNGRSHLAALDAQVAAIDRDYQDLKRVVVSLDSKIDSAVASLSNRFESALSGLSTKLDSRSQTPWQTIWAGLGVVFLAVTSLGTALYWPIQRETSRLDGVMSVVLDKGVFSKQYDADSTRVTDLLRGLRSDLNVTIQQQRYNADQERLAGTLDVIRNSIAGKEYVNATFADRAQSIAEVKKSLESASAVAIANQTRIGRLEEGYKINEKNLDTLFKRNYDLATRPDRETK